MNFQQLKILSFIQVKKNEKILQVDETAPEQPQPAVQSEEQPETITSNTDEQETIEDIENFIANKPTEEVTQKEAEITPGGQAKGKVEKILKGSLDSIPSPSPSVKNQIMSRKVCLRCKVKTLLGIVNKLLKTKSLLTSPSNVLPYYVK